MRLRFGDYLNEVFRFAQVTFGMNSEPTRMNGLHFSSSL